MRKKSSKGITIKSPILKKPIKSRYGRFIPYINFNNENANIIILSYQPGYGKTYNALKFIRQKGNKNTFYFTSRHDTIQDWTKEWNTKYLNIKPLPTHWMGFNQPKRCTDKYKKTLYKTYKISPSKLCEGCNNKNNCLYISQFNSYQRVFSPVEYLSENHFKDKISKVKTIFIDEQVSKVDVRSINKKEVINAFKEIKTPSSYITDINKHNYQAFTNKKQKTIMDRYWDTIDNALKNNNRNQLKKLINFNPSYLIEYFEWGRIYNFNKDKYGIPFYYYVFEALNLNPKLKVVILDASFNRSLFRYFIYSYNGEKGFNHPITIQEYTTNEKNPKTIVFRMRPTAWHPKISFSKKYDENPVEEWVPKHLTKIREIFGDENVGIITFKELGEKCKFLGFNVEYYGDLRSKNTFENKPVLVVLGHFFPPMPESRFDKKSGEITQKGLEEIIDEWFLRTNSTYKLIELKQEIFRRYGKTKRAKDWKEKYLGESWPRRYTEKRGSIIFSKGDRVKLKPVQTIQDYFDDEIYQAVHRNRGLQKPKIIFVYCWIPEKSLFHGGERLYKIFKEFTFRKITIDEEDDFFNSLKDQIGDRKLVSNILNDIEYKNKTSTDIADDYKISRKGIYNKPDGKGGTATQYINVLKDGIYKKNVIQNNKINPKYKINFSP